MNSTLSPFSRYPTTTASTSDSVCVPIDLPGETVTCTRQAGQKKIRIMLRKHRDIIFDLQLSTGMEYTVHAEQSDFYSVRDKKLIEARLEHRVRFKDGERFHVWVPRQFKGALILSANGTCIGRYPVNQLDPTAYGSHPADKPAPLMVVLRQQPRPTQMTPTSVTLTPVTLDRVGLHIAEHDPMADLVKPVKDRTAYQPAQAMMHIVEIKPLNGVPVPTQVTAFFTQGGEQTALDNSGLLTRNWLLSQMTGSAAYVSDNLHWIKELWKEKFYLQKVSHKKAGIKYYIVFKGNPKLRGFLSASRYAVSNTKVLSIASGAGSASGLRHAAWEGLKSSVKKAGLLSVFFTVSLDTAEWLNDYEQRDPATGAPKKDFFDLAFMIGIDFAKAMISAALGAVVMATLIFLGVITGGVAIVVGAICISVAIGFAVDWLDRKTGATDAFNKTIREHAGYLEQKISKDYGGYDKALEQAMVLGVKA